MYSGHSQFNYYYFIAGMLLGLGLKAETFGLGLELLSLGLGLATQGLRLGFGVEPENYALLIDT